MLVQTFSLQEIREITLREEARLTFDFRGILPFRHSDDSVEDHYVTSLGFLPIGEKWRRIERQEALHILESILSLDLAYLSPVMPRERAHQVAGSFLAHFTSGIAHFRTNGSFDDKHAGSWESISDATFDHGVVAFDDEHIGILWAEDED
jgi:hypothetical protein